MTKSMTAYSQATTQTELGELSCELRTVNHRYLDIAPRMPEELRVHEPLLRETISAKLNRSRVDCFIRLKENDDKSLEPNPTVAAELQSLLEDMQKQIPSMQAIRAIDVLRWPGVLQSKQANPEVMQQSLVTVLNDALAELIVAREKEGQKMAELIQSRLDEMDEILTSVVNFLPEIVQSYRNRLEEKLTDIREQLEPNRLEQEMVIFLQKTDVAEELDRLKVHIAEVASVLNKPEPAGRRLDFLMQELNREVNTLGSKSQDQRLTKASVDLKVLIEQMREQVQNIE